VGDTNEPALQRHFGLLQATALNVTMVVGAGVFITIPPMLKELPGPYALLGWLLAGVLMIVDGLIWSELGATFPGSGGTYLYLLECYGRNRWGRLMAFLFIWQFLISGPLEIGSGLIAISTFADSLSPSFHDFNEKWSIAWTIWKDQEVSVSFGPSRLLALGIGVAIVALLYRRISVLGKVTVTFWIGVLVAIGWILAEGLPRFQWATAFDFSGRAEGRPEHFGAGLGAVMRLAMYSYLGYYNVCYIGDEVREPGKTIPRSILLSALTVCVLFVAVHLALLGTVSWTSVPTEQKDLDNYSLAAQFMARVHPGVAWPVTLMTLLLIWSSVGSAFAGLLGYSRIPYGAARYGHFFAVLGKVHARHLIPHVSLLLVGGLSLFWSFFSLATVIDAMITTRIAEQFVGQIVGVILLRRAQPDRPRPYKMWLYPVPCGLALAGWMYMYVTAKVLFILLGMGTLLAGCAVFLVWTRRVRAWPFADAAE
jgi:amino acid transporter